MKLFQESLCKVMSRGIICISNQVEYLDEQHRKYWTKLRVIYRHFNVIRWQHFSNSCSFKDKKRRKFPSTWHVLSYRPSFLSCNSKFHHFWRTLIQHRYQTALLLQSSCYYPSIQGKNQYCERQALWNRAVAECHNWGARSGTKLSDIIGVVCWLSGRKLLSLWDKNTLHFLLYVM